MCVNKGMIVPLLTSPKHNRSAPPTVASQSGFAAHER